MIRVAWATHEAAKFAVEHWHYSHSLPVGKLVKIGVWEDNKYIGCVIFSRGANRNIGTQYGLGQTQCCELTRVALKSHKVFVSEVLSKAIDFLKQSEPKMILIISYADAEQGHKGGIYQATNWIYQGKTKSEKQFLINGIKVHPKTLYGKYGRGAQTIEWVRNHLDKNAVVAKSIGKHKYLMPLNKKARRKLQVMSNAYPKNANGGLRLDTKLAIDLSDCDVRK